MVPPPQCFKVPSPSAPRPPPPPLSSITIYSAMVKQLKPIPGTEGAPQDEGEPASSGPSKLATATADPGLKDPTGSASAPGSVSGPGPAPGSGSGPGPAPGYGSGHKGSSTDSPADHPAPNLAGEQQQQPQKNEKAEPQAATGPADLVPGSGSGSGSGDQATDPESQQPRAPSGLVLGSGTGSGPAGPQATDPESQPHPQLPSSDLAPGPGPPPHPGSRPGSGSGSRVGDAQARLQVAAAVAEAVEGDNHQVGVGHDQGSGGCGP